MYRIRVGGNEKNPILVTEKRAEKSIKDNAKLKPEYAELYLKIQCEDLTAGDFKCHRKCRGDLTRPVDSINELESPEREVGEDVDKFENLVKYIDVHVLFNQHPWSMAIAVEIYKNAVLMIQPKFCENEGKD